MYQKNKPIKSSVVKFFVNALCASFLSYSIAQASEKTMRLVQEATISAFTASNEIDLLTFKRDIEPDIQRREELTKLIAEKMVIFQVLSKRKIVTELLLQTEQQLKNR